MKYFLTLMIVVGLISLALFARQNSRAKLGGAISPAKAFWLYYTVMNWFFFLPWLCLTEEIPSPLYELWAIFSGWFWLRGLVELFMLFVTKNWTPPIGITHNISCILLLLIPPFFIASDGPLPGVLLGFHFSLVVSVIMETWYAWSFYKIVGEKTKGDEAVWYANKEDPAFKRVVRVTAIMNNPLYLAWALVIVHFW